MISKKGAERVRLIRASRVALWTGSALFSLLFSQAAFAAENRLDFDINNDGLIEINDLDDLNAMRDSPAGDSLYGKSTGCPATGCFGFYLTADLNFDTTSPAGVGAEDRFFTPGIGWSSIPALYAVFDGGGHVIRNLTIVGSVGDLNTPQGLFGNLGAATVRNLRFEGVNFSNFNPLGGTGPLAGEAFDADISNVSVGSGSIIDNGAQLVGGIVGHCSYTEIRESFTNFDVRASDWVGGIVGLAETCGISRSFVMSRVTSQRYHGYLGGLIGQMVGGFIKDSFVSGTVGEGPFFGGLVGWATNVPTITNAFVSGAVVGTGAAGGGLVGFGPATYTSTFFATDTTGFTKARTGGSATAVAVTLADLKCTDTANDPDCRAGLFSGWQNTLNSDGQAAWDFGTNQQVPALRLKGVVYRDGDGDGVLDANDKFPTIWAASADNDNDGAPDYWREGCDDACQNNSGLVLDQFPHKAAAAKDLDLDGRPDAWNASCNATCQATSGLTLDTRLDDFDNDGIVDAFDQDDDGLNGADVDVDSDGLIEIHNVAELMKVQNDPTGISLRDDPLSQFGLITNNSGCPPRVVAPLVWQDTTPEHRAGEFVFSHDNVIIRGAVLARHCRGYELLSDLDLQSVSWDSLGHQGDDPKEAFQATFEGNGHTITNLKADLDLMEGGLFGGVRGATIRNLGIVGSGNTATSGDSHQAGILAGIATNSTITNCYTAGSVSGVDLARAGGLVGLVEGGLIKGTFATGSVNDPGVPTCVGDCSPQYGGLVGFLRYDAQLIASFATVGVNANRGSNGGLVGVVDTGATISGSFSMGSVQGTPGSNGGLGGLIGTSEVTNSAIASHWVTDTSGLTTSAGGAQATLLSQLQCPVGPTSTGCRSGVTLVDHWDTYLDSLGRPYWNQGTSAELPGLCLSGKLYRATAGGSIAPTTPCNCTTSTQQLVTNQTFETNTAGWAGGAGTTISSSTLQWHSGTHSLRVQNRTQGTWQGAEYPMLGTVAGGDSLSASAWARISGDPSQPVKLSLRTTCQGAATVYTSVASGTATNTGWVQLSGNLTIPSCTLTEATVYVEGPRTNVELFVDDASITRTKSVCPGGTASISGIFNTTQSGSDWYCGTLTINNPFSLATADWSSVVNLNGTTMYDIWNLHRSSATGNSTIVPGKDWAKSVAANGSSVNLGFCANRAAGSNLAPSSVIVTASF